MALTVSSVFSVHQELHVPKDELRRELGEQLPVLPGGHNTADTG
jgi:hypothetical protein